MLSRRIGASAGRGQEGRARTKGIDFAKLVGRCDRMAPRSEKALRLTTRSGLMGRAPFPPHRPDGSASVGRACSGQSYMLINLSD